MLTSVWRDLGLAERRAQGEVRLAAGLGGYPAEQFLADQIQVHQRTRGKQPVGVLLQPAVAHLHESAFGGVDKITSRQAQVRLANGRR